MFTVGTVRGVIPIADDAAGVASGWRSFGRCGVSSAAPMAPLLPRLGAHVGPVAGRAAIVAGFHLVAERKEAKLDTVVEDPPR